MLSKRDYLIRPNIALLDAIAVVVFCVASYGWIEKLLFWFEAVLPEIWETPIGFPVWSSEASCMKSKYDRKECNDHSWLI